ncbi:MAG: rhomboid family intramembrane serine protease [Bacteriovoracaceae bacterium]|nr:rhomboid family intramembrane serine protease [Bacteriovoracaceae bacterium]
MQRKPITTILFILACILFTVACEILNNSIYGIDENVIKLLSFNPTHPLTHFGLGFFCSIFIHINLAHIATNLFFIVPICLMIERKKSSLYLFILIVLLHFITLLTLSLASGLLFTKEMYFVGTSHVVIALYTFWSLSQKRFSLFLIPALVLIIGFWQGQSHLTHLAHFLGMLSALLIATCDFFLIKKRS